MACRQHNTAWHILVIKLRVSIEFPASYIDIWGVDVTLYCLAQVSTGLSSKKQCGAAYLIYYEQSLCLSGSHTEQAVRSPVWAALNYQVKDITEPRRTFAFILYLTTRGPSHLSFGLSCVSFRSGGNHRSSRGFYVQLFIYLFYFSLLTFWGGTAEPVGTPPVRAAAENKLLYANVTVYISLIHMSVFFKILQRVLSASTEKVGTAVKFSGMKYAKQAHHRE